MNTWDISKLWPQHIALSGVWDCVCPPANSQTTKLRPPRVYRIDFTMVFNSRKKRIPINILQSGAVLKQGYPATPKIIQAIRPWISIETYGDLGIRYSNRNLQIKSQLVGNGAARRLVVLKACAWIFPLELPMQCCTPVFGRPENYFNHWTISCKFLWIIAAQFGSAPHPLPDPLLQFWGVGHQVTSASFFGSFLGKPALQRFPIWINGLCSTDQRHMNANIAPHPTPTQAIIQKNYFTSCDPHHDITFCYWQIFWHSIWHIFWYSIWHSIWHIFWHSTWHIFWQMFWHIFWHIFWHMFWHIFWHIHLAFYLAYLLAYYLANLLAFHLAFYLAYLLAYYLANLLAFYLANILALYLAYLLAF